jgi:hypothetical protein
MEMDGNGGWQAKAERNELLLQHTVRRQAADVEIRPTR